MTRLRKHILLEAKRLAKVSAGGSKLFKSGDNLIIVNPTGQDITTIYK